MAWNLTTGSVVGLLTAAIAWWLTGKSRA